MHEDDQPSKVSGTGPSETGGIRLTILALFFLSGVCGLVYEVVWMRMLTLVFGATAFATSTILASFFSGLALGSFLFGRVIDKGRNPLKVYAVLEVGIGLFAFLMPLLFLGLNELYVGLSRQFDLGFYQLTALRLVGSFLVLLIPATLMGGTLPVLIKYFAKRQEKLGWDVGLLYSTNTFGAVVGSLSAGFFLILFLGVREAAYAAGVVNLLIAGMAFALDRRHGFRPVEEGVQPDGERDPKGPGGGIYSSNVARLALWTVGISGFCALALEVFWTRALVFYLDNSTHAFSTMLTAFLLGIAIGSAVIARFINTGRRLLAWLGIIQVLIGITAILASPVLDNLTPVIQRMAEVSLDSMLFWKWTGMRFLTSLTVMLVPTVLMGMTFPLVSQIYTRRLKTVGTALGNVYSVNTIGGVLGSVLAGFVLIPFVGVHNGILFIAAINLIMGLVLILSEPSMTLPNRLTTAVASGILFAGLGTYILTHGGFSLTSYYERMESVEVLSYDEGVGATVKVFRDGNGDGFLSIDGFPVAGTSLGMQDAQKVLAHVPLLLSNVPSPRVNVIGFGTGGTSWGILQYGVQELDCVELVPGVPEASIWFPEMNFGVLREPRFNLILGDGRNYALVSDREYDVISIDATSPKMAGNGSLYSVEFYQLNRDRLSEDGLMVQWLPFHLLSDSEMRMTARSFMTVFPHSTLWLSPLRHHAVLVGTMKELEIDFASLKAKLERRGVQQELNPLLTTDYLDFLSWFVAGEETLAGYIEGARLNTDNHPYLEFTPANAFFVAREYQAGNLQNFREMRESVVPYLANVGETEEEAQSLLERVQMRFEATQHSIMGDVLFLLGMRERALVEYDNAVLRDPESADWLNAMRLF
ncbi:fused MFS/spermidine synthase [Gemmatimonadota bacterium]